MKSITKNLLVEAAVKSLAMRQFSDAQVDHVEELKGGMFNSAYILSCTGMPEKKRCS